MVLQLADIMEFTVRQREQGSQQCHHVQVVPLCTRDFDILIQFEVWPQRFPKPVVLIQLVQLGSIKDALKMKQQQTGKNLWILFFIFRPYKTLGIIRTCEVFGFAPWTDGPVFSAGHFCFLPRESSVQKWALALGLSKVHSFHSTFSIQCPRSTSGCLYQPGGT